jgi:hypothetical protein
MAAVRAGFAISEITELAPDTAFASSFPRAEKYVGWPMLVVLQLATTPCRMTSPPATDDRIPTPR